MDKRPASCLRAGRFWAAGGLRPDCFGNALTPGRRYSGRPSPRSAPHSALPGGEECGFTTGVRSTPLAIAGERGCPHSWRAQLSARPGVRAFVWLALSGEFLEGVAVGGGEISADG